MNTFFFDDVQYPEGLFGGKDFFNPIIYSTEEREVGVGENNKPLYQKTIESGSIPADSDVTTGLTNIESYHVIAIEVINLSNNGEYSPNQISMYNYQGVGTWYGNVFLTNNELKFNNNSRVNAIKVRAVIQYTKTTDVAGSAQYTTLGVPAHHYDGNEKVIGTWFGETLYERTFNGLATNTNGDSWVNIGGIDASTWKDAVNVEIYCNSSDVNNKLTRIALGEARVFNGNVQVTTSVSYNREINVATIQYTKTS